MSDENKKQGGCLKGCLTLLLLIGLGWLAWAYLSEEPQGPLYPATAPAPVQKSADFTGEPPNIILINADDLGYGDLGCYGGKAIQTPNIDSLAKEGVRFTDFHACDSVCTPSRAGMLTGRYPARMEFCYPLFPEDMTFKQAALLKAGKLAAVAGVLDIATADGPAGLHDYEITMAEALKKAGYRTGMVGKWHLGDYATNPKFNPVRHGFDFYFGVPHSNDMHPFPLYRNETQLEANVTNQAKLTGLYTKEAVDFIEAGGKEPFFLYLAHTFPHRPLFASADFKGKSEGGTYGDTVEEIDWSLGQILAALEKNNLEQNTVVLFTSDNGPWYQGSAGGLRGRKGQSWEGGHRVPLVARWPGKIRPGSTCDQPAMNIDFLPTFLDWAGLAPPADRAIDGRNIGKLFTSPKTPAPDRPLYFYHVGEVESVRQGNWKFVRDINHYTWPEPLNKKLGRLNHHTTGPLPLLFNLESDSAESYNLMNKYPEKGAELKAVMENWEKKMEANPLGLK